jgi:reactive intermediate/imine deaminase
MTAVQGLSGACPVAISGAAWSAEIVSCPAAVAGRHTQLDAGLVARPIAPVYSSRRRMDLEPSAAHHDLTQERIQMTRHVVRTQDAPQAIGTYSQAVRVGDTVYLSGQIPLVPETMRLAEGDIACQIRQVFANLHAVARAAGGDLGDIVKLTVYLTDLRHFSQVNEVMGAFFQEPYPARAVIGVAALPKEAAVEVDAVMVLRDDR